MSAKASKSCHARIESAPRRLAVALGSSLDRVERSPNVLPQPGFVQWPSSYPDLSISADGAPRAVECQGLTELSRENRERYSPLGDGSRVKIGSCRTRSERAPTAWVCPASRIPRQTRSLNTWCSCAVFSAEWTQVTSGSSVFYPAMSELELEYLC